MALSWIAFFEHSSKQKWVLPWEPLTKEGHFAKYAKNWGRSQGKGAGAISSVC